MSQPIDFLSLAKAETNARKRIRLLALAHFQDGHTRTQIAFFLKVGRNSVNKWVTQFHTRGLAGLDSVRPPGRMPGSIPSSARNSMTLLMNKVVELPAADCGAPTFRLTSSTPLA